MTTEEMSAILNAISDLRVELKGEINSLRGDFVSLEKRLNARMDNLENEVRKLGVRVGEIAVAS